MFLLCLVHCCAAACLCWGAKKAIKIFLMNIEQQKEEKNDFEQRARSKSGWQKFMIRFMTRFFQLFSIIVRPDIELLWHKYWTARWKLFSPPSFPFERSSSNDKLRREWRFLFQITTLYGAIIRKVADIRGQKRSFPLSLTVFFLLRMENRSFPLRPIFMLMKIERATTTETNEFPPEDIITGFSINLLCGDNIGV